MNCPRCGTPIGPGVLVCPNCGTQLSNSGGAGPAYAPPASMQAPPQGYVPGSIPGGSPMQFGQPQMGIPMAPAVPQNSTLAVVSLVLGIASYVLLPGIGALGAIITGHMARSEIRRAQGRMQGDGLALGGLILGYLHFVVACIAFGIVMAVFGGLAAAAKSGQLH